MNTIYSWLSNNRPKTPLHPQGIVIHSTAGIGAPAQNIVNWFDNPAAQSSAHGVVDWDKYIQCIPYNEVAWHAGPTANSRYIGIEMCETNDSNQFQKVWNNTVELCADICSKYGFNPDTQILSHHDVSLKWKEVDHTDPDPYFKKHDVTMKSLKKDISAAMVDDTISAEDLSKLANKVAKVDANNKKLYEYYKQIEGIASNSSDQLYEQIDDKVPLFAKEALNYFVNNKFLAQTKAFKFNPPLTYDTVRALTIAYNIIQGKAGKQ